MCKTNYIIADNIKRLRKQFNLTQEKFAELTDLSLRTIVNIETSKHFPKAKNIDPICEKLNIECFELFINHQKELSTNAKLAKINSILETLDEDKIENIYKIIIALSSDK